jgi:ATP-dependent Lon protease
MISIFKEVTLNDPTGANEFHAVLNAEADAEGYIIRPVLPLRGMVIYPNVVSPVSLTSAHGRSAVEAAQNTSGDANSHGAGSKDAHIRQTVIGLGLRTQPDAPRDSSVIDPDPANFYTIGVEIALGRTLKIPDDVPSVLVQGRRRVEVIEFVQTEPYILAKVKVLDEANKETPNTEAMMQAVLSLFQRALEMNDTIPEEVLFFALNADEPGWLADLIASTLSLPFDERQSILEILDSEERLRHVATLLGQELNVLELKDEITNQVQQEMDRTQREIYLREQMRVIQNELGEEDFFQQELNEVREQITKAELPPEVYEKALKELSRLAMMTPIAPEAGMVRTYIDWLTSIPWKQQTQDLLDVKRAQEILDREHYGLPKVKDRILEYIAVRKLMTNKKVSDDPLEEDANKATSPILCFVGPPGVGKTSLGKSIAAALGRNFVRVSLGGIRDEAEIRGHRRTYIGALPGRVVQTMKRAGTINPVFVLDEIDKLGADFRGDPSAALLEILDPEQNYAFSDHYLDVPYDLSKVLFITTANDLDPLPAALLDRLEVIELNGYTEEEKIAIARQFLIPRQLEAHGLDDKNLKFDTSALQTLIREYTYEAGVRNLNREIANVCRKVTRLIAEGKRFPAEIKKTHVRRYLGVAPFDDFRANDKDDVGVATGLAWTPYGGDVLTIEVQVLPGKGSLMMTGSLGDVMQESAQAALSYMRSRAEDLKVPYDDFENFDVHVHIPEGAVPKDGPSAGITLATAIISAFTERKVRCDYAMTGEITLRGKVLPVGGIKEKILAARRARVKSVIIPKQNEKDLEEIPKEALADMKIIFVEDMQSVMDIILREVPTSELKRDKIRRERDERDDKNKDDEK